MAEPTEPDAFYVPHGDGRFAPTRATESPWDRAAQHGGPPAALLAHLIDRQVEGSLRLARLSIDFFGAIPRRELTVTVETIKPGRRVWLSQATIDVDGRTAAVARAWHIATGIAPPEAGRASEAPRLPPPSEQRYFDGLDQWGYGEAIEWRFTSGGYNAPGTAGVWTRVRPTLIAGEPLSALARTLIVADSANGLSALLPLSEWWSIPPGMSTLIARAPVGEWIHLACETRLGDDGIGIAQAELHDERGFVGVVGQPLMVARR